MSEHGKLWTYNSGCRCDPCRDVASVYRKARRARCGPSKPRGEKFNLDVEREALGDLLNELFPLGLTDDCPARKALQPVGEGP